MYYDIILHVPASCQAWCITPFGQRGLTAQSESIGGCCFLHTGSGQGGGLSLELRQMKSWEFSRLKVEGRLGWNGCCFLPVPALEECWSGIGLPRGSVHSPALCHHLDLRVLIAFPFRRTARRPIMEDAADWAWLASSSSFSRPTGVSGASLREDTSRPQWCRA